MTDPINPPGGENPDDLDALLDSFTAEEPKAPAAPAPAAAPTPPRLPVPPPAAARPAGAPPLPRPTPGAVPPRPPPGMPQMPARPAAAPPPPPPPPPRASSDDGIPDLDLEMDLPDLGDDDEMDSQPTRMVSAQALKEAAAKADAARASGSSGLGGVFKSGAQERPTAPPPASMDADDDLPAVLSDDESTKSTTASPELEETREAIKAPPPSQDLEPPSVPDESELTVETTPEDDLKFELGRQTPVPTGAPEASEDAGEALEISDEAEAPSIEAAAGDDDAGPTLDAADDDGPVFETDSSDEESIDLVVGDDEEVSVEQPSESDRGAMLAATVTSRKRALDPADALFHREPRAEVESRVAWLEAEAEHADPRRAAEMLAVAGELAEGVMGDVERAQGMYSRAHELDPTLPFPLRALRRLAVSNGDAARARELCDAEAKLPLSPDERRELEVLGAEVAAGEGAAPAEDRWEKIAGGTDMRAAIAELFLGGSRHDQGVMGDALGKIGQMGSGALGAAASLARARLAEGAAEADTAFAAVTAAVQRDPSDVGSWLAMARLAIGRENPQAFREAMNGIARAGSSSATGFAAVALERSASAVLSDAMVPTSVPLAGVDGWLVMHALRDGGHDDAPQVEAALAVANDAQRNGWATLAREPDPSIVSEVGLLLALRRAVASGDAATVAPAAGALLGDSSDRAALESALLARKGGIDAGEVRPLETDAGILMPPLTQALMSASEGLGVDAAEARVESGDAVGLERANYLARVSRAEGNAEAAREAFEALADSDAPTAARVFAARETARLGTDTLAIAGAFSREAGVSTEPKRTAMLHLLASALGAGQGAEGVAPAALDAARALTGEAAAAELVALLALRSEVASADAAEVLASAAGDGGSAALRMFAVRAALRRAESEPEVAAASLFKVWGQGKQDGALAALALRALPPEQTDKRIEILRDSATRVEAANPDSALAAWTLLAYALADAGKPSEAAQALARARTHALNDPSLLAWEEKLWLRAEMFAEVAERSFDQLKAAQTDEQRIAAYEKLAELDSAFRGDVASAVMTYQAILELAPGHMASLRTLERYFLENGRYDELLGIYDRLIRHVTDVEDAGAIAHAAARIAIKQAEGDTGAGAPFWALALERGAADMRTVQMLDAESRRTGDAKRWADVALRGEQLAVEADEKATFATRAGEGLVYAGDFPRAVEALERAIGYRANHPIALALLGHAREKTEDARGAAEAYETLAASTKSPAQALNAYLRASMLWHDKANEPEKARVALQEVLARDPGHPEAFRRQLDLLSSAGDRQAEMEMLDARLQVGGEPAETLPLYLRLAGVAEELGDTTRAKLALKSALQIEPDRQESLRALARLARESRDWPQAADAMIKLARLTQNNEERVDLMFSLGEIFDQHLGDAKRAEAAYKRVLQLVPGDTKTLVRLADLYHRMDDGPAEADALKQLVAATAPGVPRRTLQIRLASVLSEKLNDTKKAEEVLESARREAPTDMDVLRAFARLYVRQEAPMALAVLLDRAASEVRRQLDADLTNAPLLELLSDILKLRGRVDGARVVSAVAFSLGVASDKLAAMSPDGLVPGAGGNAVSQEALELLAPPSLTVAHREIFRLGADVLEKLLPFEPGALRAEKLGARPHAMRAEIERWAKTFGMDAIDIFLGPAHPLLVLPVGRHPPAVMIPADLKDSHAARFAIARAVALVALSLPLAIRLSARDLTKMLAALSRQFEPMFTADGADPAQVDDLSRRITRVLPKARHSEMAPHAFEVIGAKAIDGEALTAGAIELANRVALLASGDVNGAIRALTPANEDPRTAVASVAAVGRIVRVAISDRFLEARHLTGADRRTSGT